MGRRRLVSDAQLLDVARTVFATQGYGASTREIARQAGLSQAALFQRFRDKPTLFLSALVPAPLDVEAIVAPLRDTPGPDARAALTATAIALLDGMRTLLPMLTALSTSPAVDQAVLAALHERLRGETLLANLSVHLARRQRDGQLPATRDPEALVEALLVAVHGVLLMGRSGHFTSDAAQREALARTIALWW